MKPSIRLLPITLVFLCFGLSPKGQAVSPPPDGGYAGGNTAEGQAALLSLTTGGFNTAMGFFSLRSNTTGGFNTATGAGTLLSNTTGDSNTATGAGALLSNTVGDTNTANGVFALASNITGSGNTAIGVNALSSTITGNGNTAIGKGALQSNDSVSNTALGFEAGLGVTTASNVICIGANVAGANVDNSCFIGNIFNATSTSGIGVFINSSGRLGTTTSSLRFKEEITPMDKTSEVLFALKPVTFRYKKEIDPKSIPQFGLVAEEVEKVDPDLVVRDKEGNPYSVRYDQVNAMLLNEFLKEHRKVEQQEATIAKQRRDFEAAIAQQRKYFEQTITELQKQMQTVIARLKEQDAQIQKVSAQIEFGRGEGQIVRIP